MLLKLSIKNYILIHELEIDFFEGFSVITGETGAGKSILLGALGLILGQRADSGILLDNDRKCIIEGLFAVTGYNLEEFFRTNELDYEDSIILRREINQGGKSRAFINDTPVNLSLLKDLGDRLVNIHSQNSIITLNDSNFQLAVIDSYAGIQAGVNTYRSGYSSFISLKRRFAEIQQEERKAREERDYYQFLLEELDRAGLKEGELRGMEEKLEILTHAEEIRNNLLQAAELISGGESNILSLLADVMHAVSNVSRFKNEFKVLVERINSNYIDIKDLSNEISAFEDQVFVDPAELENLAQRIDHLYRLLKKHQKSTVEELIVYKQEIEKKVVAVSDLEELVEKTGSEIAQTENDLMAMARTISARRQKVVPKFEKEIVRLLSGLGISVPVFKVEFTGSGEFTKDGIDRVRFLFSANKGIEARELSHAASGGELSRLMLSVKSMISQKNLLPTIFFDEIDNGVSGETAGKVGTILKHMGSNMQVIAITHLPQIAGKGDHHYWVFKSEQNRTSATFIKLLSPDARVGEIAKMLSSERVTDAALKTANELLSN